MATDERLKIALEALRRIARMGPARDDEPEPEDYPDTESAFDHGYACGTWDTAEEARNACEELGVAYD